MRHVRPAAGKSAAPGARSPSRRVLLQSALGMGLGTLGAAGAHTGHLSPARPSGRVRLVDHCLADSAGPFLGLGVSYFTALWRCKHERARLHSDLAFLAGQGFRYLRMLSMVGWYEAWKGLEIAPISYRGRDGRLVQAWPDYWKQVRDLVDIAFDRYGLRTQITHFADAQLMPEKPNRIAHMDRMLSEVVAGREQKVILLEVANEAWQNGFPGSEGLADLREFTRYLADRTDVLVATTSNHERPFRELYEKSAADIATWHFSRDRAAEDGWKPVHDCWDYGEVPGCPPVSSNEPIGPGSSVSSESDPVKLITAAAFAFAARLPMYVFHSEAGVFGKASFEETPAIRGFRPILSLLPRDLPNWRRHDSRGPDALFTLHAGGVPDRTWPDIPNAEDGCVRMAVSRKDERFLGIPIGIRRGGLLVTARANVQFRVCHPVTARTEMRFRLRTGEQCRIPAGAGAWILFGSVER